MLHVAELRFQSISFFTVLCQVKAPHLVLIANAAKASDTLRLANYRIARIIGGISIPPAEREEFPQ